MSVIKGNHAGSSGSDFYSYKINQSLRFNDGDSAHLYRTTSGTPSSTTSTVFSCWVKRSKLGAIQMIWTAATTAPSVCGYVYFNASDQIQVYLDKSAGGSDELNTTTTALFRDVSSWYHIAVVYNTADSTTANKSKIYVNGVQQAVSTSVTGSAVTTHRLLDNGVVNTIGKSFNSSSYFDGYLAEFHVVDGVAGIDYDDFGETQDGVWVAKSYSGGHGNNGYYLPFDDSSAIGDDESSNTNDFTVSGLAATDVVPDSPTNNWCTLNSIEDHDGTPVFSEGNLRVSIEDNAEAFGTFGVLSGKWYWEIRYVSSASNNNKIGLGIADADNPNNNGEVNYGHQSTTYAPNDILAVAVDVDNTTFSFYKNNTAIETNTDWSSKGFTTIVPLVTSANSAGEEVCIFNFGQDSSFAGAVTAQGNSDGKGIGDFYYSPPSGFLALASNNLPDPTIGPTASTLATDNFNTVLYTGNNATNRTISGFGFNPDWNWLKARSIADNNVLTDILRGTNHLHSNTTDADSDLSYPELTTDGIIVSGSTYNNNNVTFASWAWKAGGSGSSNSNGSITSSVSANTDAGFSIVSYTGTGSNATVGHGLGVAPSMMIVKVRSASGYNWRVYHASTGATKYLDLNLTNAAGTSTIPWNDTAPTSTVFTVGTNPDTNGSSLTIIAYCFANTEGYLKAGSYTGNGSSNGTFVYTGFRPAWVLIRSSGVGHWIIFDDVRHPSNVNDARLYANLNNAEDSSYSLDLLSNGFKLRHSGSDFNSSGQSYVYLAFAEQPFKFANAR